MASAVSIFLEWLFSCPTSLLSFDLIHASYAGCSPSSMAFMAILSNTMMSSKCGVCGNRSTGITRAGTKGSPGRRGVEKRAR